MPTITEPEPRERSSGDGELRSGAAEGSVRAEMSLPTETQAPRIPRIWPFKRVYYGWAVVLGSFLAAFGAVPAHGPLVGIFVPYMAEDLGWSVATLSLAFTLGSMAAAFSALVVGRYLDRYGARVIIVVSGVVISVALVGVSQVTEPWHYWLAFGTARAVTQSGVEIGASVAVAKWFVRKRGRALAVRAMGLRSSQALMPLLIFAIIAAEGWRTAWLALAGIAAVLVVLPAGLLLRRQPEDLGLRPDGDAAEDGVAHGASRRQHAAEVSWTLAEARRTRAFWLILFLMMMTPFTMGATNFHIVNALRDKGLDEGLAIAALSIFAAVSAVAIPPLGYLYDRIPVRFGAMLMGGLLTLSMAVMIVGDGFVMAVVFGVTFGVATGSRSIVETMLLANYFGRASLGTLRGFAGPFRLLSPLGPLYAGLVRDATGSYAVAFATFGAIGVLMCAAMFLAKPPVKPA